MSPPQAHECSVCETQILEAASEDASPEALLALAADCADCRALAEDLAVVAPALNAVPDQLPDPLLLARTRGAASVLLARKRARRVKLWMPAVAAALLPVAVGWNLAVGWLGWELIAWALPAAVAPVVGTLALLTFSVLSLTAGAAVYGGLPLLAARAGGPASPS